MREILDAELKKHPIANADTFLRAQELAADLRVKHPLVATECVDAGLLPWRHNALRHSFCTYRAAAAKNVPQTALEAGNSAATIFSHYRALATEAEGKAWFAIEPKPRPRASGG